jgi:hypothetical protein
MRIRSVAEEQMQQQLWHKVSLSATHKILEKLSDRMPLEETSHCSCPTT